MAANAFILFPLSKLLTGFKHFLVKITYRALSYGVEEAHKVNYDPLNITLSQYNIDERVSSRDPKISRPETTDFRKKVPGFRDMGHHRTQTLSLRLIIAGSLFQKCISAITIMSTLFRVRNFEILGFAYPHSSVFRRTILARAIYKRRYPQKLSCILHLCGLFSRVKKKMCPRIYILTPSLQ